MFNITNLIKFNYNKKKRKEKKDLRFSIWCQTFGPSQRFNTMSSLLLLVVVYFEVLCGLTSKAIISSVDFAHVPHEFSLSSFSLKRCRAALVRVTTVIFSTAQSSNPHNTIITFWLVFQGTSSLESFSVLFEMIYCLSCDPQN